ncbi:unnamed protein product [Victoria cruziana]
MDHILKAARASGSLNLSNRSLRELPNEVYKYMDACGEGEKWWEAVELQKLIVAHNSILILRDDLRNLTSLTVLNVSHNRLTQIPPVIGELIMLKMLDISFNMISYLPSEIGSLTSLIKLDCSGNLLKELPNTIGRCTKLSEIKVSNNSLAALPEELMGCAKLAKLDMEGNKLVALPESIFASCKSLVELNAAKNAIARIPEILGLLSRLIHLDLHQNRISSLPSSISGCTSLSELYLGNNLLSSLPVEMGELSQLRTLDLHSNQLKEYPVEACKLQLLVLDLSNNSLSGLPSQIGMMMTLRKLLLTGNPLGSLRSNLVCGPTATLLKYLRGRISVDENASASAQPSGTDDLVATAARLSLSSKELSLRELSLDHVPDVVLESVDIVKVDISKNFIKELPEKLSLCSSLQALILSYNKISEWPVQVLSSLPNLTCLKLDHNPLFQIPSDAFGHLSRLKILDLSGITAALPETNSLSSMLLLEELYMRRMHLQKVPLDIENLHHLRILDLSQNLLVSVPEGFSNLASLTELDLSDNNITALPAQLVVPSTDHTESSRQLLLARRFPYRLLGSTASVLHNLHLLLQPALGLCSLHVPSSVAVDFVAVGLVCLFFSSYLVDLCSSLCCTYGSEDYNKIVRCG